MEEKKEKEGGEAEMFEDHIFLLDVSGFRQNYVAPKHFCLPSLFFSLLLHQKLWVGLNVALNFV